MNENKSISWIYVILMLVVFWPIGLYLLWKKTTADRKATMSSGKLISIIGWVLIGFCIIGITSSLEEEVVSISDIITALIIFGGVGVGLVLLGRKHKVRTKKYKRYINLIINQREDDVNAISSIMKIDIENVKKDLTDMIEKGIFQNAYIDERKQKIIIHNDRAESTHGNTGSYVTSRREIVVQCKNCSAMNTVVEGSVEECDYCGSPLGA